MISVDTFEEMLEKISDHDFILKVIQAGVILSKSRPIEDDFKEKGNFVRRLVSENYHNEIYEEHYNYAVELFNYEQLKELNGLGGSFAVFPERQAVNSKTKGVSK